MFRTVVVLAAALSGCGSDLPSDYAVDRALVSRRGSSTDTLAVPGGADTLDVELDLALVRGAAGWALLDPAGAEVWGGAVATDTVARFRALRPAPGPWRLVLRPDRAVGTAALRGSAR